MRALFWLWAAAFLASSPSLAAEPLQPKGKWVVDFDDSQCVAFRNYGSEERPLYLVLKAPPLGSVLQLSVMRKGARLDPQQSDARLIFGQQPPIRTTLLSFRGRSGSDLQAHLVNLPATYIGLLRREKVLDVYSSPRVDHQFALTQMEPLLKIVDECVVNLREYWNVGGPQVAGAAIPPPNPTLKKAAEGTLAGLFRSDDYPAVAVRKNQQGTAMFVVLIDESGKVADCSVTETSGVAALDAQSCAIIRERARFKPAIGLDGKPARSGFQQRVTWRMM